MRRSHTQTVFKKSLRLYKRDVSVTCILRQADSSRDTVQRSCPRSLSLSLDYSIFYCQYFGPSTAVLKALPYPIRIVGGIIISLSHALSW